MKVFTYVFHSLSISSTITRLVGRKSPFTLLVIISVQSYTSASRIASCFQSESWPSGYQKKSKKFVSSRVDLELATLFDFTHVYIGWLFVDAAWILSMDGIFHYFFLFSLLLKFSVWTKIVLSYYKNKVRSTDLHFN